MCPSLPPLLTPASAQSGMSWGSPVHCVLVHLSLITRKGGQSKHDSTRQRSGHPAALLRSGVAWGRAHARVHAGGGLTQTPRGPSGPTGRFALPLPSHRTRSRTALTGASASPRPPRSCAPRSLPWTARRLAPCSASPQPAARRTPTTLTAAAQRTLRPPAHGRLCCQAGKAGRMTHSRKFRRRDQKESPGTRPPRPPRAGRLVHPVPRSPPSLLVLSTASQASGAHGSRSDAGDAGPKTHSQKFRRPEEQEGPGARFMSLQCTGRHVHPITFLRRWLLVLATAPRASGARRKR